MHKVVFTMTNKQAFTATDINYQEFERTIDALHHIDSMTGTLSIRTKSGVVAMVVNHISTIEYFGDV